MAALTEMLRTRPCSEAEGLEFARSVLRTEAEALAQVSSRLDGSLIRAAEALYLGPGRVIVTGMGKAGLVGRKLAATLSSTGTPAYPMHPSDAVHGDLGRVCSGDVVVALSQSGETEEVVALAPTIRHLGATLIAITGRAASTLGRKADICIEIGPIEEACPHGLAPSASTTAMMALGDALALLVSRWREFGPGDFAIYHPGGALGRRLSKVEDVMRTGSHVRLAKAGETLRQVFIRLGGARRRTGAIMVVGDDGRLSGIFTDSDLARLFESRRESQLDGEIGAVMTKNPVNLRVGAAVTEAIEALRGRKLSELPIVDDQDRPVGLVDVTDLIGLGPLDIEPTEE
jgi:arabinose-5-phosphate isomerase